MSSLYVTLAGLKSRLHITDTSDDDQLTLATIAASMAIDRFTARFFGQVTATQVFPTDGLMMAYVPDLVSVTALAVDTHGNGTYDQVWSAGDYRKEPANALTENGEPWPYTRIRAMAAGGGSHLFPYVFPLSNPDRLQITGVWGWPAVPAMVSAVALQVAQDAFKLKDVGPAGVEGSADNGVARIGNSPVLRDMLSPYVRGDKKVGV